MLTEEESLLLDTSS